MDINHGRLLMRFETLFFLPNWPFRDMRNGLLNIVLSRDCCYAVCKNSNKGLINHLLKYAIAIHKSIKLLRDQHLNIIGPIHTYYNNALITIIQFLFLGK